MHIDIVVPTSGNTKNLNRLLKSVASQTLSCRQVILVFNGPYDQSDIIQTLKTYALPIQMIWMTSEYPDYSQSGPSMARMIGIRHATAEYVYQIDDDNELASDFLFHTNYLMHKFARVYERFFVCPMVMYRDTGLIQSVGFSHYSVFQSRPMMIVDPYIHEPRSIAPHGTEARFPQMIGANAICGRKSDFQSVGRDTQILMTMEDIDRSMRASQMGYQLIVPADLSIAHHERNKTILEHKFIHTPTFLYYKTSNRIRFVSRYLGFCQRWISWIVGLPLITIYTMLMILIYIPFGQRYSYFTALFSAYTNIFKHHRKDMSSIIF